MAFSVPVLTTAFRKYTILFLAFPLCCWMGIAPVWAQLPAPAVEQEPSGAELFNVRELEAANPFALAGMSKPGAGEGQTDRGLGSGAFFLVDITYRMPRILPPLPQAEVWSGAQEVSAQPNPFALGASRGVGETAADSTSVRGPSAEAPEAEQSPRKVTATGGWFFYVLLSILAYLTLLASVYRDELVRHFLAFANMNMAVQTFRDRARFLSFHDLLLYLLFFMSGGSLVYLAAQSLSGGYLAPGGPWWALLGCMGGLALVFSLKHLQLLVVSAIFPFGAETRFYGYLIGNANKTLGIVLVPLSFLSAYAPESIQHFSLWLSVAICLLTYGYLGGRGVLLASTYLTTNKFHFLLYICAVEIAPIAALVKIIFLIAGY
jgi:hypothetical protein